MRGQRVLMSQGAGEWGTPPALFRWADEYYGRLTLDAAATADNTLLLRYWDKRADALKQDWRGERLWINPPYGRQIDGWIKKAIETNFAARTGTTSQVFLLPARTDTHWFARAWHEAQHVLFIAGRIKFVGAEASAPFPSVIVVFDARLQRRVELIDLMPAERGLV